MSKGVYDNLLMLTVPLFAVGASPSPQPSIPAPASQAVYQNVISQPVYQNTAQFPEPVYQNNPWSQQQQQQAAPPPQGPTRDADAWLHSMTSTLSSTNKPITGQQQPPPIVNGTAPADRFGHSPFESAGWHGSRAVQLSAQPRSQSLDTGDTWRTQNKAPMLSELSSRGAVPQFQSQQQTVTTRGHWSTSDGGVASANRTAAMVTGPTSLDPFDAAWAAKASSNPGRFQGGDSTVTKSFEVNL